MTSSAILDRLLTRLDQTLCSPEGDPALRRSQYERNRIGANIEHARAMLLTLEKQSAAIRAQSQRQKAQTDLQQKRDLIKKLNRRLRELNDAGQDDDDDDEDGEEEEDSLSAYAPARADTEAGLDIGTTRGERADETQKQQELRSRGPNLQASDNRGAALTTAREQLFAQRSKQSAVGGAEVQQTETFMAHNRTEQETLTNGLLGLARALKESSLQFGASLEAEKDVVRRAESGLDKNAQGMEAAEKRMGTLRRMSEGQGWWGRVKLYGFIFGLWLACFLIVFVGPKLRF